MTEESYTYYGKLFDFLESEFGITPIITEMNDLIHVVKSLKDNDKDRVVKFMADHGFLTGTAESIPDLLGELSKQIFELRQGAR